MSSREPHGWAWFEENNTKVAPEEIALCRAFARALSGPDGKQIQDHLSRLVLGRRLAPNATNSELWHLEGQRSAIAYLLNMIERGSKL